MNKHYLLTSLTIYLTVLTSYEVHCRFRFFNPLHCFSNNITYDSFGVNFYFSSKTQNRQQFTSLDSTTIDFNPKRRTVVTIHGLLPQIYPAEIEELRAALVNWGDINLIEVDWRAGCTDVIQYVKAVVNTEYTAIKTKELLSNAINAWKGTDKSLEHWGPLHIVGHSLGAHVAGQIAEYLKQDNVFVDRVTGLDPAGPCFHDPQQRLRLKKTNARFVDAVHTDGGTEDKFQLGMLDPVGHVDFYVNGGRFQPGCLTLRFKRETINVLQLVYQVINENGICQHLRAFSVFSESLKQASRGQCAFWAFPWDSRYLLTGQRLNGINTCNKERCIEMGINAENYKNASGVFYVPSSPAAPFCNY